MPSKNIIPFIWPEINTTISVVAVSLAVAIFVFGLFSGTRANKVRFIFSICLSTVIGWFTMPLAVKAAAALHVLDTKAGVVILVTIIMFLVAAVATSIYEIITVTFPDIGMASKK